MDRKTKEIIRREHLQRLIDASPIAIISTDLKGKITSFSKGAEKMYGYAAEEVLGKHAKLLQLNDTYKMVGRETYDALMRGEILEGELLNVRKNGEVFPVYLHFRSILDDQGRPIGMLSLAQDITERKRTQEALKSYAARLEKANRLKDLFIDIMHHDLLNPVGIIKNFVELLAADESSKSMQEEIRVLHRNARKLEEIIESASKLAKIKSMEKIEFQKQDLNVILREVIQSFEQYLVEKGMQIEYESEGEYPAKANPIIEEVFSNLLSNAVKYSPEKSRIVIGIEDDGKNWKVGVKDYGVGVPDEFKETIFERFKRVDRRGVKGTGMGLAIVKRLVEMHNGKVWVEDNPDGGSIFYVALPKLKLC